MHKGYKGATESGRPVPFFVETEEARRKRREAGAPPPKAPTRKGLSAKQVGWWNECHADAPCLNCCFMLCLCALRRKLEGNAEPSATRPKRVSKHRHKLHRVKQMYDERTTQIAVCCFTTLTIVVHFYGYCISVCCRRPRRCCRASLVALRVTAGASVGWVLAPAAVQGLGQGPAQEPPQVALLMQPQRPFERLSASNRAALAQVHQQALREARRRQRRRRRQQRRRSH